MGTVCGRGRGGAGHGRAGVRAACLCGRGGRGRKAAQRTQWHEGVSREGKDTESRPAMDADGQVGKGGGCVYCVQSTGARCTGVAGEGAGDAWRFRNSGGFAVVP